MQEFKSREIVQAEQYFNGKEIEGVKIGKNDPHNRWDDTPDGPYVQREQFKFRVNEGDWIVKKYSDKFPYVYSDVDFKNNYELKSK